MNEVIVTFYWDGELEPFTVQQDLQMNDLPKVGDVFWVRKIDIEADDPLRHGPPEKAIVLERGFDLFYQPEDDSIENKDDGKLCHRIVLARTPQ